MRSVLALLPLLLAAAVPAARGRTHNSSAPLAPRSDGNAAEEQRGAEEAAQLDERELQHKWTEEGAQNSKGQAERIQTRDRMLKAAGVFAVLGAVFLVWGAVGLYAAAKPPPSAVSPCVDDAPRSDDDVGLMISPRSNFSKVALDGDGDVRVEALSPRDRSQSFLGFFRARMARPSLPRAPGFLRSPRGGTAGN